MLPDGDIDYRGYSRAQLEDALQRIDRTRYPQNHARLLSELAHRPQQVAEAIRLPDRLVLSGMHSVVVCHALPGLAVAVGVLLMLQALGLISIFAVSPSTRSPMEFVGPLVFLGGGSFMYFRFSSMKSVVLEGRELLVRGLRSSDRVLIDAVDELYWVQRPFFEQTPIAAIRLRTPCAFGREIEFVASASAVRQFQAYLEARSANDSGA